MAQSAPGKPGVAYHLKAEIRRQPKKAIILSVLVVVLIALSAWEVLRRGSPARATAAVVTPGAGPGDGTGSSERDANDTAGARANGGGSPEKLAVDRDLFTPDPTYFPARRKPRPATVIKPIDDSIAMKEAQERAVRAQAQALALQSTIVGDVDVPTAIINGEVLRVGDLINGFRVVDIAARTCTVEKANLRITLEMTN
jgi:hypothetical protein